MTTVDPFQPLAYKSKMNLLCQALTRRCRQQGRDSQLPSIRQLARDLRVSTGTLHYALGELERQNLVVRRHGQGIYVGRRVGVRNIAIVLGLDPNRPTVSISHGLIIDSIRSSATRAQQVAELFVDLPYEPLPNLQRRMLAEQNLCGLIDGIIIPASAGLEQIRWLQSFGKPLVMAGQGEVVDYSVRIDHEHMMREGVDALVRDGCRRLGVIGHVGAGIAAFERQVDKAGAKTQPQWIHHLRLDPDERCTPWARSYDELGHACAKAFLDAQESMPDGLVIDDEMLARGALLTLVRRGVDVGRRLRVCTHQTLGNPALAELEDLVHRMVIDPADIGNTMFNMLNQVIDGQPPRTKIRLIRARRVPPIARGNPHGLAMRPRR